MMGGDPGISSGSKPEQRGSTPRPPAMSRWERAWWAFLGYVAPALLVFAAWVENEPERWLHVVAGVWVCARLAGRAATWPRTAELEIRAEHLREMLVQARAEASGLRLNADRLRQSSAFYFEVAAAANVVNRDLHQTGGYFVTILDQPLMRWESLKCPRCPVLHARGLGCP